MDSEQFNDCKTASEKTFYNTEFEREKKDCMLNLKKRLYYI